MALQNYRDLTAWQKGVDLSEEIYRLVKKLPPEEENALSNQMRLAAVSIPSCIADGQSRDSKNDFRASLYLANGFVAELSTHLIICKRLGYLSEEDTEDAQYLLTQIERLLANLIFKLKT